MVKKIYSGYTKLEQINGVLFTSSIQNQIYKKFIENNLNGSVYLSTNENLYNKNDIILKTLLKNNLINGIIFLSTFFLPKEKDIRKGIYLIAKKNNKSFHFIIEELNVYKFTKENIQKIEDYILFNNPYFIETKVNLNSYEKKIIKKNWSFI